MLTAQYSIDFYNTTNISGDELKVACKRAASQQALVLDFFQQHPDGMYTASQVYVMLEMKAKGVPLTSVRRAMSNLKIMGKLLRTSEKRKGFFGADNYKYMLSK